MEFDKHGDERGTLIALEQNRNIPFEIKRVYYMYETDKYAIRGGHAHRELQQVLICVHGSCKVLLDDGEKKQVIELKSPECGIYINSVIWREMYDFSEDAVLMVVASELYDETDYIRDYQDFLHKI